MSSDQLTNPNIAIRPEFDYINVPYLPREGVQSGGNNKFRTMSLFLETCRVDQYEDVMWVLSEHEVYVPKLERWIPSAWMVYINAADEYDALRKICGNVRQWDALKKLDWFARKLEDWQAEQAYLQRSMMKDELMKTAMSGGPGNVTACRTILQMIDGKTVGRPKKAKQADTENDSVENDAARLNVVTLHRG